MFSVPAVVNVVDVDHVGVVCVAAVAAINSGVLLLLTIVVAVVHVAVVVDHVAVVVYNGTGYMPMPGTGGQQRPHGRCQLFSVPATRQSDGSRTKQAGAIKTACGSASSENQ